MALAEQHYESSLMLYGVYALSICLFTSQAVSLWLLTSFSLQTAVAEISD